jgi:hypothetical protein
MTRVEIAKNAANARLFRVGWGMVDLFTALF